jgi:cardiolipin synthase
LRDPELLALIQRIDQGPIHVGGAVQVYFRREQAFAAILEAIAGARREVLVESYILKDDATGQTFAKALVGAAGRGVVVRVLADALGSWATHFRFWHDLAEQGVEVRLFRRLSGHLLSQAFRDHRKIVVVDRRIAFTGGMNIADRYGSPWRAGDGPWRDTHARVEGPTAWEMAVVFSEGWIHAGGAPLGITPLDASDGTGPRILVLDSRPGRGHLESASVLAALIGGARDFVWITNSYFAPMGSMIEILARAAHRGLDVRLLLPGPTDVPLVRHAGHGCFSQLLARGVRIFEYQGAVLHAKTLVADGFASVIGSSNLDLRSYRFNAECNLVILDETTGATMSQAFRDDLERASPVLAETWSARSRLHRLGDSLARLLSPVL